MSIRTLIALALATCGTFVLACSDDPDGRVDGGGASGTGGVGSGGVGGGTGGSGGTGGVGGAAPDCSGETAAGESNLPTAACLDYWNRRHHVDVIAEAVDGTYCVWLRFVEAELPVDFETPEGWSLLYRWVYTVPCANRTDKEEPALTASSWEGTLVFPTTDADGLPTSISLDGVFRFEPYRPGIPAEVELSVKDFPLRPCACGLAIERD